MSDLFQVTRGQVLAAPNVSSNPTVEKPYPVYSSQTKDNGLLGYYKDFLFKDAITWTTDGANAGTVRYRSGPFFSTNVNGVLLSSANPANQMVAEQLDRVAYKYVSHVGNPKLMNNVMAEITISIPSVPEQDKISELFIVLDELIAINQRKADQLQRLKRAYLQQLFPTQGQTIPRLRFPGFQGEWESVAISEIADRYDNKRVPVTADARIQGNTPYYGANGIQDYVDGFTHDGEFILVAEDGANDLLNYPVQYVTGRIWVNNHAHVIHSKTDQSDDRFLQFALAKVDFQPYLVGGGRAKLTAEALMQMTLRVPSKAEQSQIAELLVYLDHIILFQTDQINCYKSLKRAYLQQMFV